MKKRRRIISLMAVVVFALTLIAGGTTVLAGTSSDGSFAFSAIAGTRPGYQLFQVTNNSGGDMNIGFYRADTQASVGGVTVGAGATVVGEVQTDEQIEIIASNGIAFTSDITACTYPIAVQAVANGQVIQQVDASASKASGVQYVDLPSVIMIGADEYHPVGSTRVAVAYGEAAVKQVQYTKAVKPDEVFVVEYKDEYNRQIYAQRYTVAAGGSQSVDIPAAYASGGREYTSNSGATSLTHNYGMGTKTYTYGFTTVQNKPYSVRVQYVDGNGKPFYSTMLTVTNGTTATFTADATYTTPEGAVYALAGSGSVIHNYGDNTKLYQIPYTETAATGAYNITINYVGALGNVLETRTESVPANGFVRVTLPTVITVGGQEYNMASGQSVNLEHNYGDSKKTYNIIYNTAGANSPSSYTVTVRYMNIKDNSLLGTSTSTARIGESLRISAPSTYSAGGTTYSLVSGQQTSYDHDFYSARRTYSVYYRDGSTVGGEVIVNPDGTVTVVTADGEEIADPDTEEAEEPAAEEEEGTEGAGTTVIPENNDTPAGGAGAADEANDPETVQLDDNGVPLGQTTGLVNPDGTVNGGILAVVIGAVAAAAILLIVFLKKRKKHDTDQTPDAAA